MITGRCRLTVAAVARRRSGASSRLTRPLTSERTAGSRCLQRLGLGPPPPKFALEASKCDLVRQRISGKRHGSVKPTGIMSCGISEFHGPRAVGQARYLRPGFEIARGLYHVLLAATT